MSWRHSLFDLRLSVAQAAPLNAAGLRCASLRIRVILVSCFLLLASGCGFHPMYGDDAMGTKGSGLRGNLVIDAVTTGAGHEVQMLKTDLEDKFNPESLSTANAQYHITMTLAKQLIPAVVKSDGTIQRYDVRFDSDFKLFKTGTPAPIYAGKVRRTGSYNTAVNANFATYEAEQDVISRVLEEMAEDYVLRISGFLADRPAP